jgi:hypothetical protein
VTFLGGAILWISFRQASLPSAEAVARVPTSVLVATGAEFVVPAAIAVIVVVLILYLVDGALRGLADRPRIQKATPLGDQLKDLMTQDREAEARIAVKRRAMGRVQSEYDEASRGGLPTLELVEALSNATTELSVAEGERERIRVERQTKARELVEAMKPNLWDRVRRYLVGALVAGAGVFCAAAISVGQGGLPTNGWFWVVIAALFSGVVAAGFYKTIDERQRYAAGTAMDPLARPRSQFPIVGLVVFIAVPIVVAIGVYFRALDAPRVEPLALVENNGTPVVGYLIAETSDRVYYGTFEKTVECAAHVEGCTRGELGIETVAVPPRMVSLPKTDVQGLSIGPRLPLNAQNAQPSIRGRPRTAREWAGSTALLLCDEAQQARNHYVPPPSSGVPGAVAATTTAQPPVTCPASARARLARFVSSEQRAIRRELRGQQTGAG